MKVGELSKITIAPEYGYGDAGSGAKIPGGATLIFEIELLDILDKERTKEEALAEAEALCTTAGAAFKSGDFNAAIESYRKAIAIVEDKDDGLAEMMLRLQRNLAIAYAKVENWRKSLKFADRVLDKEAGDQRALLRKAEAHLNLGELAEARKAVAQGLAATKAADRLSG